jgi:ubiquinone/menaquinone biosynthesis C-methylase UbiE
MTPVFTEEQRAEALARYYDLDFLDVAYDAELYQQLAHEAQGPVFELGVGSGRLGIPLAMAGHTVVGLDNDAAMLGRARDNWARMRGEAAPDRFTVRDGDFLSYRSDEAFALSFIAVNTFLLATDDEQRLAILATMREQLREGGIAAVEATTPDEAELERYDGRLQHEWLRHDPETGEEVTKSISAHHDTESGTVALTQIYEWTTAAGGPLSRVTKTDTLHLITAADLGALAERAGFGSVDLRGDHLLTPHGAGSHRVILVARLV